VAAETQAFYESCEAATSAIRGATMKVVTTENITLDGVVEAVNDWFAPAGDERDMSDIRAELQKMMEREDALLLGRVTF
jgi:hypothetical protein